MGKALKYSQLIGISTKKSFKCIQFFESFRICFMIFFGYFIDVVGLECNVFYF